MELRPGLKLASAVCDAQVVVVRGEAPAGQTSLAALSAGEPIDWPVLDADAVRMILYTSGTTGLPKGALISHRAHIARTLVFAAQLAR